MGEQVLERSFPSTVTAHATSLVIESRRKESVHEITRLVGECRNLRHLDVTADRVSELASCVPAVMERLSYLHLHSSKLVSPDDLSNLLRLVPNVEFISSLPPTPYPVNDDIGPRGPRLMQHLALIHRYNTPALLRSVVVHGWNVHTIFLSVIPPTLEVLEQLDLRAGTLPATRELSIVVEDICTDETTPLCALIVACNLRRLTLYASAEKTTRLLAAALGLCGGLRALSVSFEDFGSGDEAQVAADTLVGAMPRGLRALQVSILPLYAPIFVALRQMCRTRRISLTIGGDFWDT